MIDKNILKFATDNDEKILLAKIIDRANTAIKCYKAEFSPFMDPFKAHKFKSLLSSQSEVKILLYGGYDLAERLKLGFFSEYDILDNSCFPISAVEIGYNKNFNGNLSHRDFLGSVLGLGITREKVGDIILEDGRAVCFCDSDIADYILINLERVKHTKVKCKILDDYKPKVKEMTEKRFTLASLRLDSLISHSFNISRGKASELIKGEKAFLNWKEETSVSKAVVEGDVITLRGYGRIKIIEIIGTTKKDRILINIGIYK
ncbi:MAG: RNA-binding protein [Lachnospirales bacterium]